MSGGRPDPPPLTDSQILLSLLQKPHPPPQHHHHHHHQIPDPAVAAVGPIAFHPNNNNNWPQLPPNFYLHNSNQHPNFNYSASDNSNPAVLAPGLGLGFQQPRHEPSLTFGSFSAPINTRDTLFNASNNGIRAPPGPPPGFVGAGRGAGILDRRDQSIRSDGDLARRMILGDLGLGKQLDQPGLPTGGKLHSVGASDVEESMRLLHGKVGGERMNALISKDLLDDDDDGGDEIDELNKMIEDSLGIDDNGVEDSSKKFVKKHDKDARSDTRGNYLASQRQRFYKRQMPRRRDILRLDAPFVAIYESLIPTEDEKAKQKQLLNLLERLVNREWPIAKLYIYGSCANSFGVSKSDIDICFALEGADDNKPEILLRLAEILESDNLKNVQALVRARVPIVKLMDPATDISCDICINNVLAVVNTKLLRDYARIDVRLRQLAFIVKHWAKSRRVNETYHGTLSSYAYVLMCIHFLQQRRPAILPCLQGMKTTYSVTIDNVQCAFFDRVDQLWDFGRHNNESISQLVWSFFNYWAYGHDYANSVISVRTGTLLSKRDKDWTRRVGNDRHLICIEDPFETSHDLGRVVDKYSIKVLREEFERAAEVMQHDPNPCVKLFEPYVPVDATQ